MSNQAVQKKLADMEYTGRWQRYGLVLMLMLLPSVVFAALTYWDTGCLSPVAVNGAITTAFAVTLFAAWRGRRETLAAMRREGLIGEDYEPPAF